MDLQGLNGELKVLDERQGLELGALKSSSLQNSSSSREVMRTGSSIPKLSQLMRRSALAGQSSETRGARLEALDTIREDGLEALAHEVCPKMRNIPSVSAQNNRFQGNGLIYSRGHRRCWLSCGKTI